MCLAACSSAAAARTTRQRWALDAVAHGGEVARRATAPWHELLRLLCGVLRLIGASRHVCAQGRGARLTSAKMGSANTPSPCEESSWLTLVVVFDTGKTWHGPRVRLYQRVRTLVEQCREHMSYPPSMRLRLYTGRTKMSPSRLLHDYHSLHDGSTVRVLSGDAAGSVTAVVRAADARVDDLLSAVSRGIAKGCVPRLTMDGCGGTYLLSAGQGGGPVAVFKPEEEEAGAPLNPRGYIGKMGTKGMKLGVRSGEGAVREVAASLLDVWPGGDGRDGGCVPPTALVELEHRAMQGGEGGGGLSRSTSVSNLAASIAPALNITSSRKQAMLQGQLGSLQAFVRSEGVAGLSISRALAFPVCVCARARARARARV